MLKFFKYLSLVVSVFCAVSCSNDDDVCVSGEATPRMKVKFKAGDPGKIAIVDTLYVDVDYGAGPKNILKQAAADSVLIPLRVDDSKYTDVFVKTRSKGTYSKFRVSYTTASSYVSPACGIKKTYENVSANLVTAGVVTSVEQMQTKIPNEDKTVLYLHF